MSYNHGPRTRAALAIGGMAALIALAKAEQLVADARGTGAAVLLAVAVFAGCMLVRSLHGQWRAKLTRPAPVRLPERDGSLEPANSAS